MELSVVIPVYNERDNVLPLYQELGEVLEQYGRPFEIIFVDDGSQDGTRPALRALAASDCRVRVALLRRNYGQTAAMQAGLHLASGSVVVTIDGDRQNDPADIPGMIDKLADGFDLVHGWRKERQDPWLTRRLPSRIANWLISRATGFAIHDLGCTLKVMRREIASELELYGEMHRFIPILAHQRGARCAEVVTRHFPRRSGRSKYGLSRTISVLLDLLTVTYLLKFFASPMKLFGALGILSTLFGAATSVGTVAMKILGAVDMTGNPLLLLTVFSWLAALQFFGLGLLGEVSARIYYGSQPKQQYALGELVNFDIEPTVPRRSAA